MFRQVIDDQVDEFNLVRCQHLAGEEARQRLLGGLPIQTHQRADEQTQALRFLPGAGQFFACTETALVQHPFQFPEVDGGKRLVHAQLVDGEVILMGAQKGARLDAKFLELARCRKARQMHAAFRTNLILEVGVNGLAALFVDQLYQGRSRRRTDSSIGRLTFCHHSPVCKSWISGICSRTNGMGVSSSKLAIAFT